EDGIRDFHVTGVQTCALPICLDRATLQVALMRDMRDGLREREYPLVDEDSLRRYTVRSDGSEPVETPLGTFATERYVQTRPGSRSEERRVGKEGRTRRVPVT